MRGRLLGLLRWATVTPREVGRRLLGDPEFIVRAGHRLEGTLSLACGLEDGENGGFLVCVVSVRVVQ